MATEQLDLFRPGRKYDPYACHVCGKSDQDQGSFGPPTIDQKSCDFFIAWNHDHWFCMRHSSELWRVWKANRGRVAARIKVNHQWLRGELPWQTGIFAMRPLPP